MPRSAAIAILKTAFASVSTETGEPQSRLQPGAPEQPSDGADNGQPLRRMGASNRPVRVLIVDDDPAVATVLEDMILEAGGESVGIITSALAAIGAAAVISPDVVLMDVRLPGAMDGIEAAGIIRARGSAAVVIVTGAIADTEIRARLKSLEGIEVVFKPVLENELCSAIVRAASGR